MKRPEILLGGIVLAGAVFVAVQVRWAPPRAPQIASDSTQPAEKGGSLSLSRLRRSSLPAPPPHDYEKIARQLDSATRLTYIEDILAARDQHIARWPDRSEDHPVKVWIQPRPGIRDFWPDFRNRARDAFYTWSAAGVPLSFLFVDDSAAAEVRLRWVHNFQDAAAGKTYWARDQNWWIIDADIEIAVHRQTGEPYDGPAIRAITLHEVGHLIGLDHSGDPNDIMAARVHVMGLSAADLRTALLIYRLPPGSVVASSAP